MGAAGGPDFLPPPLALAFPPSGRSMVGTSIVERNNLTIRTFQRRFTRLALGFSRKLENLRAAVALQMAYYNFVWIPRTLRVTPAMAAGIVSSPWEIADLLGTDE